jgi:SNF2 family DNA or RNA helicase
LTSETIEILALVAVTKKKREDPTLIVTPKDLQDQWVDAFEDFVTPTAKLGSKLIWSQVKKSQLKEKDALASIRKCLVM